jgi:DNA-binding PadR family transcriptional regulator
LTVQPLRRISGPRGLLRLFILLRLSKKPMSGYDLMSDLDDLTGGGWHPGSGSIYPTLEELKKRGLVEASSRGARSKQVYSLTSKGTEALDEHRKMVNQFARKWHKIGSALTELIDAENMSVMVLESTRRNRAAWDHVIRTGELDSSRLEQYLLEYRRLLEDELRWVDSRLKKR